MSCSIFIVGSLLLMAVAFSHGSPYYTSFRSHQQPDALSANEQCRHRKHGSYNGACQIDDPTTICEALKCISLRGDIPAGEDTGPAHDGTWCGPGLACFEGTCTGFSPFVTDPFFDDRHEDCSFDV